MKIIKHMFMVTIETVDKYEDNTTEEIAYTLKNIFEQEWDERCFGPVEMTVDIVPDPEVEQARIAAEPTYYYTNN